MRRGARAETHYACGRKVRRKKKERSTTSIVESESRVIYMQIACGQSSREQQAWHTEPKVYRVALQVRYKFLLTGNYE